MDMINASAQGSHVKIRRLGDTSFYFKGDHDTFARQDLISDSPHSLLYNSQDVSLEKLVLDQLNLLIDIFLYSRHLSAWNYIDILRRNSVLVTQVSQMVNRGENYCNCDQGGMILGLKKGSFVQDDP